MSKITQRNKRKKLKAQGRPVPPMKISNMSFYQMCVNRYGKDIANYLINEYDKITKQPQYEYSDNYRIHEVGNAQEQAEYERQAAQGCCGVFKTTLTYQKRKFIFGFNYGH